MASTQVSENKSEVGKDNYSPRSYTPTPSFPMPEKGSQDLLVYLNECLHVYEAKTLYYRERINCLLSETDAYVQENPECSHHQLVHLKELERLYWELNVVLKETNICLKRQQVQLILEPFRHCTTDKYL